MIQSVPDRVTVNPATCWGVSMSLSRMGTELQVLPRSLLLNNPGWVVVELIQMAPSGPRTMLLAEA